mmetsp:Transcript_61337/g.154841  ORF Transcript_61337/g.154841 Transcript_61337/m.154841 type:complete len:380 (-) Transcript_61337:303-1442(-)
MHVLCTALPPLLPSCMITAVALRRSRALRAALAAGTVVRVLAGELVEEVEVALGAIVPDGKEACDHEQAGRHFTPIGQELEGQVQARGRVVQQPLSGILCHLCLGSQARMAGGPREGDVRVRWHAPDVRATDVGTARDVSPDKEQDATTDATQAEDPSQDALTRLDVHDTRARERVELKEAVAANHQDRPYQVYPRGHIGCEVNLPWGANGDHDEHQQTDRGDHRSRMKERQTASQQLYTTAHVDVAQLPRIPRVPDRERRDRFEGEPNLAVGCERVVDHLADAAWPIWVARGEGQALKVLFVEIGKPSPVDPQPSGGEESKAAKDGAQQQRRRRPPSLLPFTIVQTSPNFVRQRAVADTLPALCLTLLAFRTQAVAAG